MPVTVAGLHVVLFGDVVSLDLSRKLPIEGREKTAKLKDYVRETPRFAH